jgi:ABC-type lipoprotein export system ATPase subunit
VSGAADTSVLRARGLRKEYGKGEGLVRAVDGVDLDIGAGETVAVMGPSGCGKSTLLHLLGGLDRPSGGEVSLNGVASTTSARRPWPGCGGLPSASSSRPFT